MSDCNDLILLFQILGHAFAVRHEISPECEPTTCRVSDGGVLCLQGEPGPVGEDIAGRSGGHRAQPAL